MLYSEALEYMYSQLPMFHRIGKLAYKANLDNAWALDDYFGKPHTRYKTIHVAGTNGKGSVSHMLAAILQKAGYRTGLFTSPHLKDFRERIRVNGEMVSEDEVVSFISQHKAIFEKIEPSFFEMTSAFAFQYFADKEVDVAIIEVGMGGRLDSTNIIHPSLSIITNIGFDHTEFLGNTLALIATEKGGIIKKNVPLIVGEYHPETWPVFEDIAKKLNAPIVKASDIYICTTTTSTDIAGQFFTITQRDSIAYENLHLDLSGLYQKKNVITVLASIEKIKEAGFRVEESAIRQGLKNVSRITGLQGRWQTLSLNPLIICDTGHNPDGIAWVVEQIKSINYQTLHIVLGMVGDKDVSKVLSMLPAQATYYFTNAQIPRALPAADLKEKASTFGLIGDAFPSVTSALASARTNATTNDFIFIGGSTFVVAEVV